MTRIRFLILVFYLSDKPVLNALMFLSKVVNKFFNRDQPEQFMF